MKFNSPDNTDRPVPRVDSVDVARYLGDWFVQAHTPLLFDRDAYNAVESYSDAGDGNIDTSYVFRHGGFDGPIKTMSPEGRVESDTGAEWTMRFIWPFRAEYVISHLDADYSEVVVARDRRDYVWVMSRAPVLSDSRVEELTDLAVSWGYDREAIRRVPQHWPDATHPAQTSRKSASARLK